MKDDVRERFINDTKNHNVEIIKNDGLYRHLKCTNNGSQTYRFDIHTWPGYLAVSGDMGCWMFSRIEDMFDFFIMSDNDFNKDNIINPGYWGEKLCAMDGHHENSYEKFSEELFEENVMDEYKGWLDSNDIEPDSDYAQTMLEALQEQVIDSSYNGEVRAYDAAMSFKFDDSDYNLYSPGSESTSYGTFTMHDFWDYNCRDYTYHYLWILYAIVWAITEYNKIEDNNEVDN